MTIQPRQGFIHVYTGNGKGKTTAALGLALRAMGAGLMVYIGQFLKKGDYSELHALKKLKDYVKVEQFGRKRFVGEKIIEEDKQVALRGWQRIKQIIASREYDVIILDEINLVLNYGLLKEDELVNLIQNRPREQELILTGRNASKRIIELADLVSEIREVKHYYNEGISARLGIEK